MTFPREKRLLLGWLALLAPLPLPFNEVLEWPVLFLYLVLVIHFLSRAEDPSRSWLDNRALNGLGLLYLPLLTFDTWQGAQRGQMVIPLLHLILFVLVVKLFSVRQEKEKWQVLLAIFFVFVAAMATSSHFAVVFYLLAALGLGLWALARLSELHMLAALGLSSRELEPAAGARVAASLPGGLPRPRRAAFAGMAAIVLLAMPIFAALPRLAQRFFTGRGAGNLGLGRVSGFSDEVSLDFSGEIRTRREIAMRLRFSQGVEHPEELRFKGSTYDFYRDRRWYRDNDIYQELRPQDGRYELATAPASANLLVYLEPLQSSSLVLPSEAVSVTIDKGPTRLYADGGGGLILPFSGRRRDTLEYQVGLANQPSLRGVLGPTPRSGEAALDSSGITPRITELAKRVMGEGDDAEKILRLERFLLSEYGYTLEISDEGGDPIEDFLFVKKAGHCEYFATAMVLMLRSQGIPARFATGFLGAEPNAIEDFLVVRQSNAHAWVEAYSPAGGWKIYDPTPPAGRPGIAQGGLGLWVRQVYEYVTFRWDRYLLTYGAEDQGDLREGLMAYLSSAWAQLKAWLGLGETAEPLPDEGAPPLDPAPEATAATPTAATPGPRATIGILLLILFTAAILIFGGRRPRSATAHYLALRRRLEKAELGVSPATPPLELRQQLRELLPAQIGAIDRLIELYLGEGFAGRQLAPAELVELARLQRPLDLALRRRLAELRSARRTAATRLPAPPRVGLG